MAFLLIVACSKDDDGDSNTIGGISNVGADINNATTPNNVSSGIEATNEDSTSNSHGKTKLPVSFKVSQKPKLSKLGILSDDGNEIQLKFEVGDVLTFCIWDFAKRDENGYLDYETGYLGEACFSLTEDGIMEDGKYAMFHGEIEIDANREVEELGFTEIYIEPKDFDNDNWDKVVAHSTLEEAISHHVYFWYNSAIYDPNKPIEFEDVWIYGETILEIFTDFPSLDMKIGYNAETPYHFDVTNGKLFIYLGDGTKVTCEKLGLKNKEIPYGKISRIDHRSKEHEGFSITDVECETF